MSIDGKIMIYTKYVHSFREAIPFTQHKLQRDSNPCGNIHVTNFPALTLMNQIGHEKHSKVVKNCKNNKVNKPPKKHNIIAQGYLHTL